MTSDSVTERFAASPLGRRVAALARQLRIPPDWSTQAEFDVSTARPGEYRDVYGHSSVLDAARAWRSVPSVLISHPRWWDLEVEVPDLTGAPPV